MYDMRLGSVLANERYRDFLSIDEDAKYAWYWSSIQMLGTVLLEGFDSPEASQCWLGLSTHVSVMNAALPTRMEQSHATLLNKVGPEILDGRIRGILGFYSFL